MDNRKAHILGDRERTRDIHIEESVDFDAMLLSEHVLAGLKATGFERPSPIQLAAIPLGRCGLDMVVQAKSGTGKTCVFTVVALEMVSVSAFTVQVLVLAPTREIAVQITQVISSIGSALPGLKVSTFIGGTQLTLDVTKLYCCHIAVGTPGRIKQLIDMQVLNLGNVRLFVLDEADQLLSGLFAGDIMQIASVLPLNKQILALSATYSEEVAKVAESIMRSPNHVRLGKDSPALLGVDQFVKILPYHYQHHNNQKSKFNAVVNVLTKVTFNQCLIFSNSQLRAESVCNKLRSLGWPVSFLSGGQAQSDRLMALDALCSYKCRILVSTDLAARGLDSEHVNLVINMDLPRDHATYLHRVGRAGRFGSRGCAITLVTEGEELLVMRAIASLANVQVSVLKNDSVPEIGKSIGTEMEYLDFMTDRELAQMVMDCTKFNQKNTSKSNSLNNHETALKSKNIRNDSTKDSCAASGKHELKELVRQKLQEEAENLKSENMKTVLSVMEKINLKQLLEPFSFSDLKSEAANIYKDISVRDNPAVFIPNLPNKVEISDKELKSFENCWKSAAEDLQEYIVRVDSEWRKGNMDTEKALMCRIEGKDITHILIDNDGNLGTENSSKNDDREISVTSSDVSDSISKSQSDTSKNKAMSRLNTIESKATSKRTSPRTKSKSKRSGENYQYMNGKSETGASQRKSMQETYNYYTRTHDHLGHSYESPLTYSNRQLYYTFDYGNSCGYSAPYQSKVDSMNENYQCNRSNGHYTSESSYTSHVNDYDNYEAFCRSSWYTYQRYLESAEKFASMMDYVQTIGRMSYWAARDYELCMNEKK